MSNSDNTTALAENKVLILYLLDQIPNGIIENGLFKIVTSINGVNYFYFKQVLTDLFETKLVGLVTKDESDDVVKITSEGKNALSLTQDVLPGIIKLKADNLFKQELSSVTEETFVSFVVVFNSFSFVLSGFDIVFSFHLNLTAFFYFYYIIKLMLLQKIKIII